MPHFGAIDRVRVAARLSPRSSARTPPDCAIFPIRVLDGIAAFLYADRLGSPMQYEDFALIARAAAATAAGVLSRFLLDRRRSGYSVRYLTLAAVAGALRLETRLAPP